LQSALPFFVRLTEPVDPVQLFRGEWQQNPFPAVVVQGRLTMPRSAALAHGLPSGLTRCEPLTIGRMATTIAKSLQPGARLRTLAQTVYTLIRWFWLRTAASDQRPTLATRSPGHFFETMSSASRKFAAVVWCPIVPSNIGAVSKNVLPISQSVAPQMSPKPNCARVVQLGEGHSFPRRGRKLVAKRESNRVVHLFR
jgi:hypothetical protein